MELLFIINPTAGSGNILSYIPSIEGFCMENAIPYTIVETKQAGDAVRIAREAVAKKPLTVVAVGGDGTVLEVANGLANSSISLGILPLGSGNDFARSLNIPIGPENISAALSIIKDKQPRNVDVGRYGECIFLNVASIGFDAEIIRDLPRIRRFIRGSSAYLLSVFIKFLFYKTKRVTLEIDGTRITEDIFLVAVCNGLTYGGGMKINPLGCVTDGFFDLVVISPVPKYKIPLLLSKFTKGKHLDLPYVRMFSCKDVKIYSDTSMVVNIDGECAANTPVHFSILPLTISIYNDL